MPFINSISNIVLLALAPGTNGMKVFLCTFIFHPPTGVPDASKMHKVIALPKQSLSYQIRVLFELYSFIE